MPKDDNRCDKKVRFELNPNSNEECIKRSNLLLKPYQKLAAEYIKVHDRLLIVYGTGLGKTLTAVTMSQCFLDANPTAKVYWLSPPAILKAGIIADELAKYEYIKNIDRYECYSYWNKELETKVISQNSLVICDEVHTLRNKETNKFKRIYKFIKQAKKRILLSATPLVNKYSDIASLMELLFHTSSYETPYIVSTTEDFKFQMAHLNNRIAYEKHKLSEKKEVFVPVKMSQTYENRYTFELENLQIYGSNAFSNAARQASNIIYNTLYERLGLSQKIIELQLLGYIKRNLNKGITMGDLIKIFLKEKLEATLPESQITQILGGITKRIQDQQKLSPTGPDLSSILSLSFGYSQLKQTDSPKVQAIKKLLNLIFSPKKIPNSTYDAKTIMQKDKVITKLVNEYKNKKIVFYTNYIRSGVFQIKKILAKMGKPPNSFASIEGTTKAETRTNIVKKFNEIGSGLNCLIITRAMSEGQTFKNVQALIIVDPPWSYSDIQQIIGRTIRLNSHNDLPQTERVVHVYKLVLVSSSFEGTVENVIDLENVVKREGKNDKKISGDLMLYYLIRSKKLSTQLLFKYFKEHSINKYFKENNKLPPYNPDVPFLKFSSTLKRSQSVTSLVEFKHPPPEKKKPPVPLFNPPPIISASAPSTPTESRSIYEQLMPDLHTISLEDLKKGF